MTEYIPQLEEWALFIFLEIILAAKLAQEMFAGICGGITRSPFKEFRGKIVHKAVRLDHVDVFGYFVVIITERLYMNMARISSIQIG